MIPAKTVTQRVTHPSQILTLISPPAWSGLLRVRTVTWGKKRHVNKKNINSNQPWTGERSGPIRRTSTNGSRRRLMGIVNSGIWFRIWLGWCGWISLERKSPGSSSSSSSIGQTLHSHSHNLFFFMIVSWKLSLISRFSASPLPRNTDFDFLFR